DLILKEEVDLLIGDSTPETTNPVADQAELNEMPCLTTFAPWQPYFFGRGGKPDKPFTWTYHYFWGLEDIIAAFTDMWGSIETNKVVGALWPNDGDGVVWADKKLGFPPELDKLGYKLVDPGRFKVLSDDFTAQISQFKSNDVQIVTGVLITPDFATFWKQAKEQNFHPKIVSIGKAYNFAAAIEAIGPSGYGLTNEVFWTP